MGYGSGAAIGAKMSCPDKTVVNIAGDGCFRMNMTRSPRQFAAANLLSRSF